MEFTVDINIVDGSFRAKSLFAVFRNCPPRVGGGIRSRRRPKLILSSSNIVVVRGPMKDAFVPRSRPLLESKHRCQAYLYSTPINPTKQYTLELARAGGEERLESRS